MAQKTKVKELVGRGLNSYHTKALQQIHRIEKKNKEQNHKISILSNELDNDYLTKTEEGSVVSLEHSKEGMVYLDELQGNTLVNYCTDGSKELTLNGDIDVEGTFVTTTEGVDNGKVDVYCEGNTLVNLASYKHKYQISVGGNGVVASDVFTMTNQTVKNLKGTVNKNYSESGASYIYYQLGRLNMDLLKTSTTYTIILDNKTDFIRGIDLQEGNATNKHTLSCKKVNQNIFVITTKNSFEGLYPNNVLIYGHIVNEYKGNVDVSVLSVLEGDWSNRELPSHFEGMKSVGQDDENGHKIEISSQNKNLLLPTARDKKIPIFLKKGTTLTLSTKDNAISNGGNIMMYDVNGEVVWFAIDTGQTSVTRTLPRDIYYMKDALSYNVNYELKYQLEISNTKTSYVEPKQNKKEILISEPLRKIKDNIKDRFLKTDKWFVERKCGETLLDGNVYVSIHDNSSETYIRYRVGLPTNAKNSGLSSEIIWSEYLADNIVVINSTPPGGGHPSNSSGLYFGSALYDSVPVCYISIEKSKLTTPDVAGFKDWLNKNKIKVIYELATPVYEPLEIEPTLNTYNDVTHISNDSIIPCTMKIKNTGYNAIIKPSTLYTVALDINKKNQSIGINLGGAKGTTTNNVLKLTTPATLDDDSLRLYGKGVKSSKIRLLEGDKTNWIPSHFEGMKSCFEDKVQSDGSYKMEILMNNRNLFSTKDISYKGAGTNGRIDILTDELIQFTNTEKTYTQAFMVLRLKPFTTYKLSAELQLMQIHVFYGRVSGWDANKYFADINNLNSSNLILKTKEFTTDKSGIITLRTTNEQKIGTNIAKNIIVEEIDGGNYVPHKQNKIQFSSIEPLRKWDRFVFKDGQLMIERGSKIFVLDGNKTGISYTRGFDGAKDTDTNMLFSMRASKEVLPIAGADGGCSSGICNILPNIYTTDIATKSVPIGFSLRPYHSQNNYYINIRMDKNRMISNDTNGIKDWLNKNNLVIEFPIIEPTYEEVPFELQKIILEGYENGTLFFDTNIPPTSTVRYAGETPIVKSVKLNKTEVLNNTEDINDNIIPYLMDMDYRVVMLQLATEELEGGVSMARLFGGTYEMIKRDILSKRLTREEYGYRLADYFNAGKLTEEQVRELEELR